MSFLAVFRQVRHTAIRKGRLNVAPAFGVRCLSAPLSLASLTHGAAEPDALQTLTRRSKRLPNLSGFHLDCLPASHDRAPGGADYFFAFIVWFVCFVVLSLPSGQALAAEPTGTNDWVLKIGSGSDSSPAIGADGTIYFGTRNGRLWAVNSNGTRRWSFRTGLEIKSSPALGTNGTIYFGCRDRKLYALRPDGKKNWEFKTGAWVDSSPALAQDGTIYFGSWDGNFYALNPAGAKQWQFATRGPIVSSPAVGTDGTIYFGSHDTNFYALTPGGGRRWEFPTRGPVISSPALDANGGIYFTSVDGFLYSLEKDGGLRWKLHTGGITESSPVIGLDGTIYLGVNEEMWAVTPEGMKKWARGKDWIESSATVAADGTAVFVFRSGRMVACDLERQREWTFHLNRCGSASPAIGASGAIYVPGMWIGFVAVRGHAPLAATAWPKFRGNARNTGNLSDTAR